MVTLTPTKQPLGGMKGFIPLPFNTREWYVFVVSESYCVWPQWHLRCCIGGPLGNPGGRTLVQKHQRKHIDVPSLSCLLTKITSMMLLKLVTAEIYFLWQNNRNTSCSFSPYTKLLGQSKLATAQLKNDTKGKLTLHLVSALMWTILRMLWISNQTPYLSISTYF